MMTEDSSSDLKERLIAGVERDGRRRRFDPQAKLELVQACLRPGVSVARMALDHGLNANLLRKWIRDYEREHSGDTGCQAINSSTRAFVPVVQTGEGEPPVTDVRGRPTRFEAAPSRDCLSPPSQLVAELPNGVMLKLACAGDDTTLMMAMIEALGRGHVPVRR